MEPFIYWTPIAGVILVAIGLGFIAFGKPDPRRPVNWNENIGKPMVGFGVFLVLVFSFIAMLRGYHDYKP